MQSIITHCADLETGCIKTEEKKSAQLNEDFQGNFKSYEILKYSPGEELPIKDKESKIFAVSFSYFLETS